MKTQKKKKYPEFHAATDMSNLEFKIGMILSDNKELKEAIRAYKIKWGFPLKFKKNEPKRVRVICAEGCDWRMHAIWKKDSNSFQIIKLVKEHSCTKAFHSIHVKSKWVARVFLEKFRLNPNMALLKIKAGIMEQYEVEISMCKAYRARQIANEMINVRFEDNYLRIRVYYEELKVSNPGTTTKISLHTPLLNFKRFYVCLDACKMGFLDVCRPIISLDACHLRGFGKGQIIAVVGIDANDGMYPIAFAVCAGENNDSWK